MSATREWSVTTAETFAVEDKGRDLSGDELDRDDDIDVVDADEGDDDAAVRKARRR
jgi:hypothetical protein